MSLVEEKYKVNIYTKETSVKDKNVFVLAVNFHNFDKMYSDEVCSYIGLSIGHYYTFMKSMGASYLRINSKPLWYFNNKDSCENAVKKAIEIYNYIAECILKEIG